MVLNTVISSVFIMGFLIAIGYFLVKKDVITIEVEKAFTYMLLNIALPALIINAFNIKFSPEKLNIGLKIILIGLIYTFIVIIVNFIIIRKVKNIGKRKILYYTGVLVNGGFMGFPIINQVYGIEGTFYASMFYIPMILYMWTYGISLFFDKIGREEIKHMLFNVNMVSLYIGLMIFIFSINIPVIGEKIISTVGGITTPLAMFIIGARIGRVKIREIFNDKLIYLGSFLRLLVMPLIMVAFLSIVELDPIVEGVCLIFSALPPPAMTVVMANRFDCEVDFSSKIIVITHMMSLITIPLMFAIFEII